MVINTKEYMRKWRKKNPDYMKEYNRRYRENHKKEIKQKAGEWYQKNRETLLKKAKEYYQENKVEILRKDKEYKKEYLQRPEIKLRRKIYKQTPEVKARAKGYYEKIKDNPNFKLKMKKQAKRYRQNNPKKVKAISFARKVPLKLACEICHSTENLQKHHWNYDKPLMVNTLCGFCHNVQHIKNIHLIK